MYNITDDIAKNVMASKKPAFITPGIHILTLSEAVLKVSKNDNYFFVYVYNNRDGQKMSKTEWQVNLPVDFDTLDPQKKLRYEKVINSQKERILKVASMFVPIEELKGNFNSFQDFCNFVVGKLNGTNFKDVELRVKATYDKDGWVTTPTYAHSEWIERVDKVPEEKSLIKIVDGKDVMERPPLKKDDTPKAKSPLLEEDTVADNATAKESITDDMPF